MKKIERVAVIGAGPASAGIVRQLMDAGIPGFHLDDLSPEMSYAGNISGNPENKLTCLGECDWVLEVFSDNIFIKRAALEKISHHIRPGTIVSSNTSSLSINSIVAEMSTKFRANYMGTHFFLPVRHMKLLELIPCYETRSEVVSVIADFGVRVLGKEIVYAKDTPAFVADRLGSFAGPLAMKLMLRLGLTIEEVDTITGSVIGRPRTGTFGLYDLVGLDTAIAAAEEVKSNLNNPVERELYTLPDFYHRMVKEGLLGNKSGGGFYRKVGPERKVIDFNTLTYREQKTIKFPSLDAAEKTQTLSEKITCFFEGGDKAAEFVWHYLTGQFLYAASKIPEISDDIINMDRGLRWGYNYELGPFAMWNGLDLPKYIERLKGESHVIPVWIKEMLDSGNKSFYKSDSNVDYYYSIPDKKYCPINQ